MVIFSKFKKYSLLIFFVFILILTQAGDTEGTQSMDQNNHEYIVTDTKKLEALIVLVTSIITVAGIVLNYNQKNRFGKIDLKLEENTIAHSNMAKTNQDNYNKITEELKVLADLTVKMDVIEGFRHVVQGYTRMGIDNKIKQFVDNEGERLIQFAEEIMHEKFTAQLYEQQSIKIDTFSTDGMEEAHLYFGEPFTSQYTTLQKNQAEQLKYGLDSIAKDDVLNHKYERFRNLCETYLHNVLLNVIRLHLMINK